MAGAVAAEDPLPTESSTTFCCVQTAADAARLARGGRPWPTGMQRANLGEGLYAWGSRSEAQVYLDRLQQSGAHGLRIMSFRIGNRSLSALRTLDLRLWSDMKVNAWMDVYSQYGQGLPHQYEHVIRQTALLQPEHYFAKQMFRLFGARSL